jgi:hypothetical protein
MLVSLAMSSDGSSYPDIIDALYARRVRLMAEKSLVESIGNLNRMRYSEVRLPQPIVGNAPLVRAKSRK